MAHGRSIRGAVEDLADLTPRQFLALLDSVNIETTLNDVAASGANRIEAEMKMMEALDRAGDMGEKKGATMSAAARAATVTYLSEYQKSRG